MSLLQNISKINKWYDSHLWYGGSVYDCELDWSEVAHPGKYVDTLFLKYRDIPFEDVLAFSESEVTDNSMPNREVMEDASKIHMLRHKIQQRKLLFKPQLIHEPWYDRYRVHPGSGRIAAMWLEGWKYIPCIYVHFNEKDFKPPKKTDMVYEKEFHKRIQLQKNDDFDIQTYHAFPKTSKDCEKTYSMDSEWRWHHIKTYRPWRFIRWSEGENFLRHKYEWRSYAIDLWHELN